MRGIEPYRRPVASKCQNLVDGLEFSKFGVSLGELGCLVTEFHVDHKSITAFHIHAHYYFKPNQNTNISDSFSFL